MILFATFAVQGLIAQGQQIDFSRDIRPILSDNCFRCHGPDEETRATELRLDSLQGALADLGGYHAVVAGSTDKSEIITRVNSQDPDLVMPPPSSNKSLTDKEKDLLQQWISEGAKWQDHWAFVAPKLPPVPSAKRVHEQDVSWGRTEIDRFIFDKLQKQELTPSRDAPPLKLIRRLYLDLIGIVPNPDEAQEWRRQIWPDGDGSPPQEEKYQALVSHLLDSPHYGERWAKKWLDLARYADTNGYEKDRDRSIWPYRDWVVTAINSDMPFDQFTIEQIAGDMLPGATTEQKVATGFHRNTMLNEEGGIDPLEFRFRAMTDRVATTGTTWFGLTLGCCQCHTHKYDPITHTEYFQLFAFLNNTEEPSIEILDEEYHRRWEKNRERAEELLAQLPSKWPLPKQTTTAEGEKAGARGIDPQGSDAEGNVAGGNEQSATQLVQSQEELRNKALQTSFAAWLNAERENQVDWQALVPSSATSNLPILTIQADHSIFASGDTAKRDDYYLEFEPFAQTITAIQLEALPDERLPARGPGTTYYEGTIGDFFLTNLRLTVDGKEYRFSGASHSYAKNRFGNNPATAELAIDDDIQTGWSVHDRQGERHVAVFRLESPVPAGSKLRLQMSFGRHFATSLGLFRFNATSADSLTQARDHSYEIQTLLKKPDTQLSSKERSTLLERFLLTAPEISKEAQEIIRLRARPKATTTLVMAERPSGFRRKTFRHHRGEYLQPKEEVTPGIPQVLPQLSSSETPDRLAFARWLVSENNPLTARVIVNRAWADFFGTGIVKTVEDFGFQGDPPSHPELLDWLAVTFRDTDGWSLKDLHRRIVSSSVYRQTSTTNPEATNKDPNNRLLSYLPRTRLDAEIIRDNMLKISGVLNRKMGGPSVRPPQPSGVTELAYGSKKWTADKGDNRYRRSLYTYMKRTAPFAMYATFDAPSGESCIAARNRSNSPLQALTILNDVMVLELAKVAGERFTRFDADRRVNELFRYALTRDPTEDELKILSDYWQSQRQRFEASPELTKQLTATDSSRKETLSGEQAATIALARAIFGLDEFLTRE